MTNSAETTLAAIEADCEKNESEMPYHVGRVRGFAADSVTVEEISAGWTDESELASLEDRLRSIQLYLENEGDKFHPHSDELRMIAGESAPWDN